MSDTTEHFDYPKMSHSNDFRLQFKHKDFICKQLALFKPYRQVARELLKESPEIPLSLDEAAIRVKYYACDNRTFKWRNRINEYRRMMEHDFSNRFRLANKHQRMIELERIFADAMTPKLRRVVWFPVSKGPKGDVTYGHKEVYERDLTAALTVLTHIAKSIDDLSLSLYAPPVRPENPISYEEKIEKLRQYLKNLDITFGLK